MTANPNPVDCRPCTARRAGSAALDAHGPGDSQSGRSSTVRPGSRTGRFGTSPRDSRPRPEGQWRPAARSRCGRSPPVAARRTREPGPRSSRCRSNGCGQLCRYGIRPAGGISVAGRSRTGSGGSRGRRSSAVARWSSRLLAQACCAQSNATATVDEPWASR